MRTRGLVSEAATTGDRLDLIAALRRLPASHRQALLLHYVVGYPCRRWPTRCQRDLRQSGQGR